MSSKTTKSRKPRNVPSPRGLSKDERKLWTDTQNQLRQQGTWADTDAPLLERYVKSVALSKKAHKEGEKEQVSVGSKGQPVVSPWIKIARDADADASRFATELLLTPASRKRAEVNPEGESDDEDGFSDLT